MVSCKRSLVVISLLALAALLALPPLAGAAGDDDVYTTIDVNFHHLGDHWVPTYQPQTPEGTEYEHDFEVTGDIESPAIKMWVRGLVPPDNVSIDFVKLWINGNLLGYINEYAMGTGSIYDVDDEVEIEVSIEEGILRAGSNTLKVVTGWGTSPEDRDDIMFWNIRLVRARPLEMSCNLLAPAPGDVHYPGLDTERVSLIVWNDRHVDALQWVRITIDPGGAATSLRWTQVTNSMVKEAGATTHATFPAAWYSTTKDILNRTWLIEVDLSFRWTFPTEGPIDIRVDVRDDQTKMHVFTFEEVLEVPTELEIPGAVSLEAQDQGPLGPGSWVRGGEGVSAQVPPVIFKGSTSVHPPPGTVSISLLWGDQEMGRSVQEPGSVWDVDWIVPLYTRETVTVTIQLVDLPQGAGAPSPVQLELEVDGSGPSWGRLSPENGDWLLSRSVQAWADLSDGPGIGIDPFSLEYQVLDPAVGTWGGWTSARLVPDGGEGGADRGLTVLSLSEGDGHSIRWRASDLVGNGPTVSAAVTFGIDVQDVLLEPISDDVWMRGTEASIGCIITDPVGDMEGSGVDVSSVEYSVLVSGSEGWSEWMAPVSVVEVEGLNVVQATTMVTLDEGSDNYVRWRARDLAGNPITVSPPDTMLVDTTPPTLVNHWPQGRTFGGEEEARAVATFMDGNGSGVDMATVEYALARGSQDAAPEWTGAKVDGDPADLVRCEVALQGLEGHDNWIYWRVSDLAGNGPAEFGPFRIRFNLPPTAVIARPTDGAGFSTSDLVELSAQGSSDPDPDDQLTYEWNSDLDGFLGSGPDVRVRLHPGEHRVRLVVTDGQGDSHVDEAVVTIQVKEPITVKEPVSPWLILLVILVAVAAIAAIREWRTRRRRRFEGLL
jgi:hypothetical protein